MIKRTSRSRIQNSLIFTVILSALTAASRPTPVVSAEKAAERPNVILVMTDDQGYGDLACHGNKIIKTPALDALYADSVRLTNFHVDPTCSPTRSALMTGRYSSRTGVWHTIMGRSIMHKDEVTIAEVFAANGYKTGIFGKWHLGDNYPLRPQDQGFQEVLIHGGGGVGQTPDFWANNYFNDTYWHNGQTKKFKGYCTDIWFDGAMNFIEANKDKPFFCYIPTNAAHGPFLVDKKYSEFYHKLGVPSPRAEFYGMIMNIDENMTRLRQHLEDLGLADNTILIFTTDNGTAAGMRGKNGYNAGMRGTKGSEYEGGHRVPFFIHWRKGKLHGGRDINQLTAHIDVLPTLADICELGLPANVDIDGTSLVPLLNGESNWQERTLFVHSQRIELPQKWRKSAVMTEQWRLVNGKELFDIQADPSQRQNIADKNPKIVSNLRKAYDGWYKHISDRFDDYVRIELGSPKANPTTLTCHDWHSNKVPWNQGQVRGSPKANGFWAVEIVQAGTYEFTLRARPSGVKHALKQGIARIKVGSAEASSEIKAGTDSVTLSVELKSGIAKMQTWLDDAEGVSRGAFFVKIRRVE